MQRCLRFLQSCTALNGCMITEVFLLISHKKRLCVLGSLTSQDIVSLCSLTPSGLNISSMLVLLRMCLSNNRWCSGAREDGTVVNNGAGAQRSAFLFLLPCRRKQHGNAIAA